MSALANKFSAYFSDKIKTIDAQFQTGNITPNAPTYVPAVFNNFRAVTEEVILKHIIKIMKPFTQSDFMDP